MSLFHGEIGADGEFRPHNQPAYEAHLASLKGRPVVVTVRPPKRQRTLQANAYYWFLVTRIADETGESEPERIHEALRARYLMEEGEGGLRRIRSTADLSTAEFADYVNRILIDASTGELIGSPLWLPRPGEGDAPEW